LGLWFAVFDPWVSDVIRAYALVHIISFMTTIVFSQKDDLVDKRRRARVWAAVCVIGHVVTVALFGSPMFQETTVLVPLTQSLSQLFASAVFTLWAVTRNEQTWVLGQSQSPVAQAASDMTKPVQIALVRQIEVAMQNEVWRQEGLTVSGLAQVVGMPEHQVRNAINQVLGYRNFSSFINKARIESAKTTLANAEHMGTSVQKIAYSVGFSSIGPFNRAFRDDTGQSPSDFRKAALAAELVDS
jgi:AraC-like DNA-binding protein